MVFGTIWAQCSHGALANYWHIKCNGLILKLEPCESWLDVYVSHNQNGKMEKRKLKKSKNRNKSSDLSPTHYITLHGKTVFLSTNSKTDPLKG